MYVSTECMVIVPECIYSVYTYRCIGVNYLCALYNMYLLGDHRAGGFHRLRRLVGEDIGQKSWRWLRYVCMYVFVHAVSTTAHSSSIGVQLLLSLSLSILLLAMTIIAYYLIFHNCDFD